VNNISEIDADNEASSSGHESTISLDESELDNEMNDSNHI